MAGAKPNSMPAVSDDDRRETQCSGIERRPGKKQHAWRHELLQKDDRPSGEQHSNEEAKPAEEHALGQ